MNENLFGLDATQNLLNFVWKYFASSDSDTLVLRKSLIDLCDGSHTCALIISQLLYWHNKYQDMDRLMKITYDEWYEQTRLTKRQMSYSIKHLTSLGYIEAKVKKFNNIPCLHFRIKFENLFQALCKFEQVFRKSQNVTLESDKMLLPMESDKMSHPYITENTEITSKNKKEKYKKEKSDSDESLILETDNQTLGERGNKEGLDGSDSSIKSDYQKNQTKNKSHRTNLNHNNIEHILQTNIFQIPEDMIQDWIENRKKKRAPITKTAWNKINKELSKCKEEGIEPLEAFETMVASAWQSLKVEYFLTKEFVTKQEEARKRSEEAKKRTLELEQKAAREKKREIDDAKRLRGMVSQASENERNKLRNLIGARHPTAMTKY